LSQRQAFAGSQTQFYGAAKVALQKALLKAEPDQARQIALLERQLTTPIVPQAHAWAMEELCDRGITADLGTIAQRTRHLYSGPRGEETVAFCKERMEIVNRDPDRSKALGSVLRVDALTDQKKILNWAVYQLFMLETSEADEILDRYATEVSRTYRFSLDVPLTPEGAMHNVLAEQIRRRGPAKRGK
jgi:hypothetical protein